MVIVQKLRYEKWLGQKKRSIHGRGGMRGIEWEGELRREGDIYVYESFCMANGGGRLPGWKRVPFRGRCLRLGSQRRCKTKVQRAGRTANGILKITRSTYV